MMFFPACKTLLMEAEAGENFRLSCVCAKHRTANSFYHSVIEFARQLLESSQETNNFILWEKQIYFYFANRCISIVRDFGLVLLTLERNFVIYSNLHRHFLSVE